eukprot:PhF_6_TR23306/c0_g1_i10/m.32897
MNITPHLSLVLLMANLQLNPPNEERQSLVDIYNTCRGPHWLPTQNRHWLAPDTPVCSWSGIQCGKNNTSEEYHVTGLDFNLYDMRCELPASGSNLQYLNFIDISGGLVGTVPSFIRYLTRLETLKLFQNDLTGTIPVWLA